MVTDIDTRSQNPEIKIPLAENTHLSFVMVGTGSALLRGTNVEGLGPSAAGFRAKALQSEGSRRALGLVMHYPFVASHDYIIERKCKAGSKAYLEEVAHRTCTPGKLYLVTSPFLFFFLLLLCGHEVSSLRPLLQLPRRALPQSQTNKPREPLNEIPKTDP